MGIRFTNTLTGKKETFQPLHPPRVTLYVCGITVYDETHVGHARGAVVFDVLCRFLKARGFQVTYIRNITDVDDKIIDRARKETVLAENLNARVKEISRCYTERFQADFDRLGIVRPDREPKATDFIPKMIVFIEALIRREAAYPAADGVYFSVRKDPTYGQLSHQHPDQMMEERPLPESRLLEGQGKKDPLDFALWKKAKPDEPNWDSPWGAGRPGWHIECTTMSTDLLGDAFDIHGGGIDLVFPHHENELAQALGAGKPFAKAWLHNGLLTLNGQKMAKSLRSFVTLEEVFKRYAPDILRFFFLSAHYRSPIDFTWERMEEAKHATHRLAAFLARADAVEEGPETPLLSNKVEETERLFFEAMDDDLNTPRALASLFGLIGHANDNHWLDNALMRNTVRAARAKIRKLGKILGFFQSEEPPAVDAQAQRLVQERDQARARKDFTTSDRIRKELADRGYVVEDTSAGTVLRKKL